ncbi:MAG: cytochrome P450 [Bacillota bacterium]
MPLLDIDNPTLSLCKLADEYGPIFRLKVPGYTSLILSGHELVADVCGDGSKMAPDVESTLQQAYQTAYGVGLQEAQDWLDQLQTEGRYAKDVWAST